MKQICYLLFSFILLISAAGCTGSKSYSNKAKKLQEAGLNDEAATFFLYALQRNPKNIDAKIGLKDTGQKQIESLLNDFYKAYSVKNTKEAVYTYQKALGLQKQYGNFVKIEIPAYYDDYYQEVLEMYLDERYAEADDLLYEEKFKDANVIYKEIVSLNPDYKDAKDLSLQTTIEPLYREGVLAFEKKEYRKCYKIMSNVLNQKDMYKDAVDYKDRALEYGQITVAVLEFETSVSAQKAIATTVQSDVVGGISRVKDPFIRVIDRGNMDVLIQEQKINVKGASVGNNAIKTGELLGANVLITGRLLSYSYTGGQIKRYRRQGFEAYRVKKVDPRTKKTYYKTMYRRVYYDEYEGSASVSMEVQYQIVSAETGEIIKSDIIRKESKDYVNYVNYNGSRTNLYSGSYSGSGSTFSSGDVVHSTGSNYHAMQRKLKSNKRTLLSESSLSAKCVSGVSTSIIRGITSYNPDGL